MANVIQYQVPISHLLELPSELRLHIYGFLYPNEKRFVLHTDHLFGVERPHGGPPGIMLVNRLLLNEVRSYVFSSSTFVTRLRMPAIIFNRDTPKEDKSRIYSGLIALSTLLKCVKHLRLCVVTGSKLSNDASVFLSRYFRDVINSRSQPLTSLQIEFLEGSNQLWIKEELPSRNIICRPGFEWMMDSVYELLAAARYFRSDRVIKIEIRHMAEILCPIACQMLRDCYWKSAAIPRPINCFAGCQTLRVTGMRRFYYTGYSDV